MDHRIAIFIDADNINSKDLGLILDEIKNYGNIVINRAYGDWSKLISFKDKSIEYGIELIQANSISGKNSSDIKLCVDAMNILHTLNEISMFYIVTSDSDFIHLVPYIKCLNKEVRCIGNERTNRGLQNIVNMFTKIEVLRKTNENDNNNEYITDISINHNNENIKDESDSNNIIHVNNKTYTSDFSDSDESFIYNSDIDLPILNTQPKNNSNSNNEPVSNTKQQPKNKKASESNINTKMLKLINRNIYKMIKNNETGKINIGHINEILQRRYQFDYREYNCVSMTTFLIKYHKRHIKSMKSGVLYLNQ
tara:strand:- start:4419 stop:5345 length:927 start_codon:yes stop_codon:yes gene_type:complete